MSIYATLWTLKFPEAGDCHHGCEWVEVIAQGVPAHIGSPTQGCGYEDGDPYGAFLSPPLATDEQGEHEHLRAVVFVTRGTPKGTVRSHQEYASSLLVVSGEQYARMSFAELHERLCDALRAGRPRVVAEYFGPDVTVRTFLDDGTTRDEGGTP